MMHWTRSGVSVHPVFIYLIFGKVCYYMRCLSLFWEERWSFAFFSDDFMVRFSVLPLFDLEKKRGGRQNEESSLSVFLVAPRGIRKYSLSIPHRHDIKPTHFKGASGRSSTCPLISAWWGSSVVSCPARRWKSPPSAPPFEWRAYFSCLFLKMWVRRILDEIPNK